MFENLKEKGEALRNFLKKIKMKKKMKAIVDKTVRSY